MLGLPLGSVLKLSASDMELGPGADTLTPELPLSKGIADAMNRFGSRVVLTKGELCLVLGILLIAPRQEVVAVQMRKNT